MDQRGWSKRSGVTLTSTRARGGKVLLMDQQEAVRQFNRGAVDVLFWLCSPWNALLRELERADDAHLCALDRAALDRIVAENPGFRIGTVPAAAVARWTASDLTTSTQLVCNADRNEDEVEKVARIIYEHRAEFAQRDPSYASLDATFAAAHPIAPMHPGAERFLRSFDARERLDLP